MPDSHRRRGRPPLTKTYADPLQSPMAHSSQQVQRLGTLGFTKPLMRVPAAAPSPLRHTRRADTPRTPHRSLTKKGRFRGVLLATPPPRPAYAFVQGHSLPEHSLPGHSLPDHSAPGTGLGHPTPDHSGPGHSTPARPTPQRSSPHANCSSSTPTPALRLAVANGHASIRAAVCEPPSVQPPSPPPTVRRDQVTALLRKLRHSAKPIEPVDAAQSGPGDSPTLPAIVESAAVSNCPSGAQTPEADGCATASTNASASTSASTSANASATPAPQVSSAAVPLAAPQLFPSPFSAVFKFSGTDPLLLTDDAAGHWHDLLQHQLALASPRSAAHHASSTAPHASSSSSTSATTSNGTATNSSQQSHHISSLALSTPPSWISLASPTKLFSPLRKNSIVKTPKQHQHSPIYRKLSTSGLFNPISLSPKQDANANAITLTNTIAILPPCTNNNTTPKLEEPTTPKSSLKLPALLECTPLIQQTMNGSLPSTKFIPSSLNLESFSPLKESLNSVVPEQDDARLALKRLVDRNA
ncbi:hypothetical protein TBLA_0A09320 [Henningerozyma blattae CBS 6284]|uniref:Uncharacterized protein n=1 Tax=Henningerozyma blattae (strain ATCC 34711 / CBS 6284 / DSM 70876 / NBRC 10599 / NRRL Y-10934 / UCD 77-7) TaxID=1071380 RepID=I2GX67_HENB6|nr:hypothetical protein TBLA_0A09320 [Tetrapisispora blattae CBS 6284]CCH58719.1 hypothetical protein TBLA_0A09320 [Tetrapisispora blattae CBS 6284]